MLSVRYRGGKRLALILRGAKNMSNIRTKVTRRRFVTTAAVGSSWALGFWPRQSWGQSQRVRVAFIGVGGRGHANLSTIARLPDVEVVGLCDVNRRNLETVQKLYPNARTYRDFRALYAELKDYDAVVASLN